MHGMRDAVIPHSNSDALHAAAPTSQLWKIPDAEHIAALAFPGPWREKLARAMDEAVK
jgi:pimeloyl-ACP methyl ester carboxylesterase